MPESIDHEAKVLAEVADLIAEYPDIPLAELAAGLERRADVYDNGADRALAVAAALRRRASTTTVQPIKATRVRKSRLKIDFR